MDYFKVDDNQTLTTSTCFDGAHHKLRSFFPFNISVFHFDKPPVVYRDANKLYS